jgi:DUF2934 family protein
MSRQAKVRSLKAVPKAAQAPQVPTTEEIAIRAYEIYQARSGSPGTDLDDWLQAERELNRGEKSARAHS